MTEWVTGLFKLGVSFHQTTTSELDDSAKPQKTFLKLSFSKRLSLGSRHLYCPRLYMNTPLPAWHWLLVLDIVRHVDVTPGYWASSSPLQTYNISIIVIHQYTSWCHPLKLSRCCHDYQQFHVPKALIKNRLAWTELEANRLSLNWLSKHLFSNVLWSAGVTQFPVLFKNFRSPRQNKSSWPHIVYLSAVRRLLLMWKFHPSTAAGWCHSTPRLRNEVTLNRKHMHTHTHTITHAHTVTHTSRNLREDADLFLNWKLVSFCMNT